MDYKSFESKSPINWKRYLLITIVLLIIIGLIISFIVLLPKSNQAAGENRGGKNEEENLVDKDYYEKSILNKIIKLKLSYESTNSIYDVIENENEKVEKRMVNIIRDKYNFNKHFGQVSMDFIKSGKIYATNETIHFNAQTISNIYEINHDLKYCKRYDHWTKKELYEFYLKKWTPDDLMDNLGFEDTLLSKYQY